MTNRENQIQAVRVLAYSPRNIACTNGGVAPRIFSIGATDEVSGLLQTPTVLFSGKQAPEAGSASQTV